MGTSWILSNAKLHHSVVEWAKLGVVQPCPSNSSCLRSVRDLPQDSWGKVHNEGHIGMHQLSGSLHFITIDVTAGFFQLLLKPNSRLYTSFTVSGKGLNKDTNGSLRAPTIFQRLMEKMVQYVSNTLVYIDDLLLHSGQHPSHLKQLNRVLSCLAQHGIKMNLSRGIFGSL